MKWIGALAFIFSLAVVNLQAETFATDPFLGAPFVAHAFDAGENAEYHATLVHYLGGAPADTSLADSSVSVGVTRKATVLYIHGFNDYFFQRGLAEKMDSAGYSFYAIDLHKYGRSYREGDKMGELRSISEYFTELDSAIAIIRRIEGDSLPLVVIGHSTGGLIACLYADARENGKDIAALVLNSPFFEMNYPWIVRVAGVPVLSLIGSFFPSLPIPRSENRNYGISLHQAERGEWNFDTTYKMIGSLDIDFGWLHAIHEGHAHVQRGLQLQLPILVMHSGCSYKDSEWSEEYERCDGVLDVEDIRKFGANLGPSVQLEEIDGGLHDSFLSHTPARDNAYDKMFKFLDARLAK